MVKRIQSMEFITILNRTAIMTVFMDGSRKFEVLSDKAAHLLQTPESKRDYLRKVRRYETA
jgi:hypothetical protein